MKKALLPTKPRAVAKSLIMLMVGIAAFFGNALAHASIKTTAADTPAPVVMLSLDGFRNRLVAGWQARLRSRFQATAQATRL